MPYKDIARQRECQLRIMQERRALWLRANGPCVRCGSELDLQVDHKIPAQKVDHKVWSWSQIRRTDSEM